MPYTKVPQMDTSFNVKYKSMKILEKNGKSLQDYTRKKIRFYIQNIIYKRKHAQIGLYQNLKFLLSKNPVKRIKRHAIIWDKVIANHISKGYIQRTCILSIERTLKLSIKKSNNLGRK